MPEPTINNPHDSDGTSPEAFSYDGSPSHAADDDMLALTERTDELVRLLRDRLGELGTAHGYSLELHRAIDVTAALGIHAKTMLRAVDAKADQQKVAVCEALLAINAADQEHPIIPPTAIDWIGNAVVSALQAAQHAGGSDDV